MESIGALLVFVLVWAFVALPVAKVTQNQKKKAASPAKGGAAAAKDGKNAAVPEEGGADGTVPAKNEPRRVMQPTIRVTEHDDSIYQGSLYAVTGEGYDPCHAEQMSTLTRAETVRPPEEPTVPGLHLGWTGSDIVRGVVMSEILNKRGIRR